MIQLTIDNAWPSGEETFSVFPVFNPWTIAIGAVLILGIGLFIYFKKKNHKG